MSAFLNGQFNGITLLLLVIMLVIVLCAVPRHKP